MVLDLLITNGFALTMEGDGVGPLENAALGIKGTDIVVVGDTTEVLRQYSAHRYIDATNKVIMPGFINAHLHSSDGIGKGLAQDMNNWLYTIWRTLPFAQPEAVQAGSLACITEALLSGTTTIADQVNGIELVVQNHIQVGGRAVVMEMIHEMPSYIYSLDPSQIYDFDHTVGERKFQQNIRMYEMYNEYDNGRILIRFGPQATDMLSLELLAEVHGYAKAHGMGLYMHLQQGQREITCVEKRYGKRPIQILSEMGILSNSFTGVHLFTATDKELREVVNSGAALVSCPEGGGFFGGMAPTLRLLNSNAIVGMGTDSPASNHQTNMFNDMKAGCLLNKLHTHNPTTFPAWRMLRFATIDSARCLHLEHLIGSLRAGKRADVILIDLTAPSLSPTIYGPIRNIVPNLVYSANGSEVDTVLVNGKVVVENHSLLTVDPKNVARQATFKAIEFSKLLDSRPDVFDLPLVKLTKEGYY